MYSGWYLLYEFQSEFDQITCNDDGYYTCAHNVHVIVAELRTRVPYYIVDDRLGSFHCTEIIFVKSIYLLYIVRAQLWLPRHRWRYDVTVFFEKTWTNRYKSFYGVSLKKNKCCSQNGFKSRLNSTKMSSKIFVYLRIIKIILLIVLDGFIFTKCTVGDS